MRTIYIVDDDAALRASLHALLSVQADLLIYGFASGDAFVSELHDLEPGVVLLDYHMPGATGLDVLQALAADARHFVPIVLTGQGDVQIAVQAMKSRAFDFLEKPCDPKGMLEIVAQGYRRLEEEGAICARAEAAQARIRKLSSRETDVLKGLLDGQSNKVIAHELGLSPRTVEIYRANLMDKLGVRSLSEALRLAFAAGLMPDG